MAYDFPNSPTNGQQINNGGAIYRYDGVKWVALAGVSAYVAKAGDVMTGALQLPGNAASALQAVPLQQVPVASSTLPAMNSAAAAGSETAWSKGDHVHPVDTSRYAASNPSGYQTAAQVTTSLGSYVAKAGDTMTGNLVIAPSLDSVLVLQKSASARINVINGQTGTSLRWQIIPGDTGAESGGNVGSAFAINAFSDTGAYLSTPFVIYRNTGRVDVNSFAQNGTDSFSLNAAANQWPIIRYNNQRRWWAGGANDGAFAFTDDTAGRRMMTLQADGNISAAPIYSSYLNSSGSADIAGNMGLSGWLFCNSPSGIRYYNSGNYFRFYWDNNFICGAVDNVVFFQMAHVSWVNGSFVSRRGSFQQLGFDYSNGWYYGATDGGTWFYTSVAFTTCDERIKQDVQPTKVDALATIRALPVEEWNAKPEVVRWLGMGKTKQERQRIGVDSAHTRIGITAQRAQEVDPGLVYVADQSRPIEGKPKGSPLPNDLLQCDPAKFMPYFVKAMQQMADKIDELEARLR